MTLPECSEDCPAVVGVGMTRSTNFWPKRVLGRIRATTSCGISLAFAGCSASLMMAPSPVVLTLRTSPTMIPRSFTSAPSASCVPMWLVFSVTGVTVMNVLL